MTASALLVNLPAIITDDMVEAAAIAIRNQAAARSTHRVLRPRKWCDLPDKVRAEYLAEARAALEAALSVLPP